MSKPNIVFIMTDQLRADCLGYAGHPDVKTPYLDTLAARGVVFDHAYSACPSCIAARAALHTGMEQSHHGRVGYEDNIPWNYEHTMAGELSKAGYYTQCVGKMHVHPLRNYLGFHNVSYQRISFASSSTLKLDPSPRYTVVFCGSYVLFTTQYLPFLT